MEEILQGLNPEQLAVVKHHEGALRVGAVAGAGKTNALVKRIAYMVTVRDIDPRTILAVTFSSRAAKEMNDRLVELGVDEARVGTWHSLCWQIVREESSEKWEVDSRDRYRTILKEVCGYRGMKWEGFDITVLGQFVTRCKANAADPQSDKAREISNSMRDANPKSAIPNLLIEAYGRAEMERHDRGLITFDDMLVDASRFLEDDIIRARWSGRWDYVLQDEAQDESPVQQMVAESLARRHCNYMVVGDPGQAIYGFRGSDPKSLVTFDERWIGAESIYMNRNYRSGSAIIDAANGVLKVMPIDTKLDMVMVPERGTVGEAVVTSHEDSEAEARAIALDVMEHVADGGSWKDSALLYRTNAQSRALEEAFLAERIPYIVLGGTNFYKRKEVRSLLSYLRIATNRAKWDDVKRTLNAPFRFLGAKYLGKVKDCYECGSIDLTWMDAVREAATGPGIWSKQRAAAETYAALIDSIAKKIAAAKELTGSEGNAVDVTDEAKPARLLAEVLAEVGYIKWLRRDEGTESAENDRVTNVRELIRASERFPSVDELLDYVDDQIVRAEKAKREQVNEDVVLMMSIHKSKGLEWPRVYLTGAVDGILPHGKNLEDPEEERRLFYVAVTRARDYFRASLPETATFKGNVGKCVPSRFLADAGLS